jgi:hypothetical protein
VQNGRIKLVGMRERVRDLIADLAASGDQLLEQLHPRVYLLAPGLLCLEWDRRKLAGEMMN